MAKIAIIIDNPSRDLNGCILLLSELIELGHEVLLVPMYVQIFEIISFKPDILIANYCRKNNMQFLTECIKHKIDVYVLDTEGGIFASNECDYNDINITLDGMAGTFVWNENIKKSLLANPNTKVNSNRIYVTGSPRFDFYQKQYRKLIQKSEYDDNKIILFNCSYPDIWPKYSNLYNEIKSNSHVMNIPIVKMAERCVENYYNWVMFLRAIVAVANQFKNKKIIVRTHPFEDDAIYKTLLEGYSNIQVRGDYTIDTWLIASSIMIHRDCTTSIEASILGIPVISLELGDSKVERNNVFLYQKNKVYSIPELINKIETGDLVTCNNEIKELIDNINYSSSKKIAKIIDDNIACKLTTSRKNLLKIYGEGYALKYIIRYLFKDFFETYKNKNKYFSDKFFDIDAVSLKINKYYSKNFLIKKYDSTLMNIFNKKYYSVLVKKNG